MTLEAAATLFACTDRELWVVTARAGARRGGLIATFVSNASLVVEMPRALVGVARQHHTWELIRASSAFALHLIGEEHLSWVWRFGLSSGREIDKLDGLARDDGVTGSPLLTDALGWLECRVEARLDTGDRTVFLGEVVDAALRSKATPLSMGRLLQLAPPDHLEELARQRRHDQAVDAAAITAWRQRREKP